MPNHLKVKVKKWIIFFFKSRFFFMRLRFTVHHKNTNGIIYSMVSLLLSIGPIFIHLLIQLCTVKHVYFNHSWGLQTSENTPGKFHTCTKVVCTFMCKNNAWIQLMCRVIYRSYERHSKSSLGG